MSESEKVSHSGSKSLNSKELTKSKPENQKTKVTNDSKSKAPTLQILKRSEPNKQVLRKTESETKKPRFQKKEAVFTKSHSKTKGSKPKVWKKTEQENFRQKTQMRLITSRTNQRGPMRIWVPKTEIVDAAGMSKRKRKAEVLVSGQWLLTTYDGRKVYVSNPDHERGRM